MVRVFAGLMVVFAAYGTLPATLSAQTDAPPPAGAQVQSTPSQAPDLKTADTGTGMPPLPPAPAGKSTILGGEISKVDPVRDMLGLRIFGMTPMKILFDERTQVFRDGKKIPLRDLKSAEHASVQTLLDGTDVFAVSIHILSHSMAGDFQGRVLGFNPDTTELSITSAEGREPIRLLVPPTTQVTREGQPAFTAGQHGLSDLVTGALVSVKFDPDQSGHGVTSQISILATPGAEFTFIGNVTSLDVHTGTLVLVDPRDDKTYQISFDPRTLPESEKLRTGQHIIVAAVFGGTTYVARTITLN
jgi:hypothetical protein